MTPRNEPRRPSLATIVGSSLAVAAAGSLIAFGSLAEQAGLQGLAVGGIQPSQPERSGGGSKAITVPAPSTAPPENPRDTLAELVRETIERGGVTRAPEPRPLITFTPAPDRDRARPERDRRDAAEGQARVAVVGTTTDGDVETADSDGPPYGHAYGHYKKKHGPKPRPPKKTGSHKSEAKDQPVFARTANDGNAAAPKAPKMQKVKPAKSNGKAKGHHKHSNGNGNGKAKGKGHSKHGG